MRLNALKAALGAALITGAGAAWTAENPIPAPTRTAAVEPVPRPHRVHSRSGPVTRARAKLVEFDTAPFPYDGIIPKTQKPFLDVAENGRRGHRTPFGRVYWEDETYSDRQVLLHIPKGFDVRRPSVLIVYFHGHGAKLADDVYLRQQVPAQISTSGVNAVLVAPQFAVRAADSSAGKFWEPGAFARFIGEAAQKLAKLHGDPRSARSFAEMPVVIVAYSGGYQAAAFAARHGGLGKRLQGLVLFDALYGELDIFADWITSQKSAFFISSYAKNTEARNLLLQQMLTEKQVPFTNSLAPRLQSGDVAFVPAIDAAHKDFVTEAWVQDPLKDLLARLRSYSRRVTNR